MPSSGVGWQPSRFLTDRAQAERAFQLAEQLGSVNAAAKELGTTWPSLREAFGATAWHARPQPPEAVRQRAIAAARQRNGQRAIPAFDPVLVALKPGAPYRNGLQLPRAMGPPATRSALLWARDRVARWRPLVEEAQLTLAHTSLPGRRPDELPLKASRGGHPSG
jgi:hypothetical protein